MTQEALTQFITDYIAARRQEKLEKFDKDAAKQGAQNVDALTLAAKRQSIVEKHKLQNMLTYAAKRAGQIRIVTHAAKFTHGGSKSSSVYLKIGGENRYLSSVSLPELEDDADGNAAALDVAKLLQTVVEGDSLLACLKRGEHHPLRALAENEAQLALWVEGFSRALTPAQPTSHKLAKQIWFPVNEGYHLLSPLFATSFTQALHEKMVALRFSDQAKVIRDARKMQKWHSEPQVIFRDLAVINFGGTKPQNISALNSARGGRVALLSSQPPVWERMDNPPVKLISLFSSRGAFQRETKTVLARLADLLVGTDGYTNHAIRNACRGYVDELIDLLFMHAATLQQEKWQGWTKASPELPQHQQLWLDPWRGKTDEAFQQQRQNEAWQKGVADDFARWLNQQLRKRLPDMGLAEYRQWKTRPQFRLRMREMEAVIGEALK